MKKILSCALLAVFAVSAPVGAYASGPHMMQHKATLHSPIHAMGFQHVMASATVRYSKGDAFIKFNAEHLPSPRALHKMAYVLFASDNQMKDRVGVVHWSKDGMAGLSGEVMMTKVQDLYVYATLSAHAMHPSGKLVLSGMVG